MMRGSRSEGGFTLTELLVALFLLAMVSAVFLPTMESSLLVTRDLDSVARSNDAARLLLAQLDREFRAAERICDPDPGATADRLEFRTRAYTATTTASGYQDLVYELRDPDLDGVYTHLQRSADGGAWRTVIEHVANQSMGVRLFAVEGGSTSTFPSEGKVVTVNVWVDTNPDDRIDPRLLATEISGRNIWTPTSPDCP